MWAALNGSLAILIALLFVPVIISFYPYIKFYDGGPVFFMQDRVGSGGVKFKVFKLRTMKINAWEIFEKEIKPNELLYEQIKKHNKILTQMDPRVAGGFANFLRKTSLDEASQIINVLRREMNIIGPRPLPLYDAAKVAGEKISIRSQIKPGITGLWQVSGRNTTTFDQMIKYDVFYVSHRNVWLDLCIAIKTAKVFFETAKTG